MATTNGMIFKDFKIYLDLAKICFLIFFTLKASFAFLALIKNSSIPPLKSTAFNALVEILNLIFLFRISLRNVTFLILGKNFLFCFIV
jgi:hypothetical protein